MAELKTIIKDEFIEELAEHFGYQPSVTVQEERFEGEGESRKSLGYHPVVKQNPVSKIDFVGQKNAEYLLDQIRRVRLRKENAKARQQIQNSISPNDVKAG